MFKPLIAALLLIFSTSNVFPQTIILQEQNSLADDSFQLTVDIEPLLNSNGTNIEGFYHISFTLDGEMEAFHRCNGGLSFIEFYLKMYFYDGNNLIYTYSLTQNDGTPIQFENDTQFGVDFWFPTDLVYDYIVQIPHSANGCSDGLTASEIGSIDNIIIESSLDATECKESGRIFPIELNINYPDGNLFKAAGENIEEDLSSFVNEHQINNVTIDTTPIPLSVEVFNPLGDCISFEQSKCDEDAGTVQLIYAVPYGGCPPYSQTWTYTDELNQTQSATAFSSCSYLESNFPLTYNNIVAANPNFDYTVFIEDASGQTASSSVPITNPTDFIEAINVSVEENACDAIISVTLNNLQDLSGMEDSYILILIDPSGSPDKKTLLESDFGQTVEFSVNLPGEYIIEVRHSFTQCSDILDGIFVDIDAPAVILPPQQLKLCTHEFPYVLNANEVNATYKWIHRISENGQSSEQELIGETGHILVIELADVINGDSHTFTAVGTSSTGCTKTDVASLIVLKDPLPNAELGGNISTCSESTLVSTTTQPVGENGEDYSYIYAWSSDVATPTAILGSGNHTVTVTNEEGCQDTGSIEIEVVENPIDIDLGVNQTICNGTSIVLDATTDNATYHWSTGESTPTINVQNSGVYSVSVSTDVCSDVASIEMFDLDFTIYELKNLDYTPINDEYHICDNSLFRFILLDNPTVDNLSAVWSTPIGILSGTYLTFEGSSQLVGTWSVTLTDNSNGCSITKIFEVIMDGFAVADIEIEAADCEANGITLAAFDNENAAYQWADASGNLLGVTSDLPITSAGTYYLTVTDNNCVNTNEITLESDNFPTINAYTLEDDEIWNDSKLIEGMMIVPADLSLTIENTTIHFMNEESGILVEKGGTLNISNGAILTHNPCNTQFWRGIRVMGNTDITPTSLSASSEHGYVQITGSTVQYAKIGLAIANESVGFGTASFYPNNHVGNGIINVYNSYFIDNLVGIYLAKSSSTIGVLVNNNKFLMKNPLPLAGSCLSEVAEGNISLSSCYRFVGIQSARKADVYRNLFENQYSTGEMHGIHTYDTSFGMFNNQFKKLALGVWSTQGSALNSITLTNNLFSKTKRGAYLSKVTAEMQNNDFWEIPVGDSNGDTYGALLVLSGGNILGNMFETLENNTETKGLVLIESNGFHVNVKSNTFSGPFAAATQFEINNSQVDLACNTYENNPKIDWFLADHWWYGDGFLNRQGDCDGDVLLPYALNNTWSAGTNIRNDWANNFIIDHDACSKPLTISGNITSKLCGFISEEACCQGGTVEEGDGRGDDTYVDRATFTQLFLELLADNQEQEALYLLENRQEIWSDKLLVSTYISRNEKAKALQVLARIPQDEASNIAFTQLYQAVVDAQPDLTPNAEQMIRAYADSRDAQTAIHAQNILHRFFGEAEIRNSAPVDNHAAKQALTTEESNAVLHIYPNPSNAKIHLQWMGNWSEGQIASLQIYHPNGKMLREHHLSTPNASIELKDLPMGTYFCRFSIDGMLKTTQKLMIIH